MVDLHLKTQTDLNWCLDILKRIDDILKKSTVSEADLSQIHWLVKQALKAEREE
jgi:diketogulonate reductase-like aldo/keto reductase